MINVSQLPSSKINREIDELKTRKVPLTYRRFSDPFKVPDNTALLQALLLAQTGKDSEIPNIIKSTTNSAFSQAINSMKDSPVLLNNVSINHNTVPIRTPSSDAIRISGKLVPSSVEASNLNPTPELTPELTPTAVNQFNVKDRLNIGHINQKTIFNPEIDIEKETKTIANAKSKIITIKNEIDSLINEKEDNILKEGRNPLGEVGYNSKIQRLTKAKNAIEKSIINSNERIIKLNRGIATNKSNIEKQAGIIVKNVTAKKKSKFRNSEM